MMFGGGKGAPGEFEAAASAAGGAVYILQLFVTGMTPRSTQALATIKSICEQQLAGRHDLEVIDIYQHPQRARQEQIIAVPTLVLKEPAPVRRLIGDMSDSQRVLSALGLEA